MNLGPLELIVILAIILLLFGAKRLPSLAKSLGQAMKELRSGVSGDTNGSNNGDDKDSNS